MTICQMEFSIIQDLCCFRVPRFSSLTHPALRLYFSLVIYGLGRGHCRVADPVKDDLVGVVRGGNLEADDLSVQDRDPADDLLGRSNVVQDRDQWDRAILRVDDSSSDVHHSNNTHSKLDRSKGHRRR